MREIKTAALIGLGAVGGYAAPKLEQCLGHKNFRVIANGKRKKRLDDGVIINGKTWMFHGVLPTENDPADLVLFTVKNTSLDAAIQDASGQIGPDTILMSLLNGVESEERIQASYPENPILHAVIRIPALNENGCISYPENQGEIAFGDTKNSNDSKQVRMVQDLFERAGISYQIPRNILKNMWQKFMTNVSENLTSAVMGVPYGIWTISREANDLREMVAKEVIFVAQAQGIDLTKEDLDAHKSYFESAPFYGKPSTLQDLEHSRKTEVETFAGTVIKQGKTYGIPTPCCVLLYNEIKAMECWNDYRLEHD